jgi:F0F1-type ATP synthase membrane subunit a
MGYKCLWTTFIIIPLFIYVSGVRFSYFIIGNLIFYLRISFALWNISLLVINIYIINRVVFSSLLHLIIIIVELLIVVLRPITLTLRVFINVIIGHEVIHLLWFNTVLLLIVLVECFVYFVQSYVFLMLLFSYINNI